MNAPAATLAPPATGAKPSAAVYFAFLLMAFGMFLAILDIQIVAASLGEIQAGLSASADEIAWVQSSYLVAEVIMIPLSGFLARALSIRWLFVLSCAGFTFASLLCALATSIETMIAARAFQGFIGGAMIPTVYAASFLLFGRERQTAVVAMVSLIVTLAPTIGPVLGGWITSIASWQWLFLVNIVPGIFISVAVALLVRVDRPDFALLRRIDIPGVIALSLLCGGLVFVLEEGTRLQWFEDGAIRTMSGVVVIAALLLWHRVATAPEPIIRVEAFANLNFTAGVTIGAIFGMGLYGLVYLYPMFLGRIAGLSSGQIGATVWVTGFAMACCAPLSAWLSNRFDARIVASAGFLLLAISTWWSSFITVEWRFWELFWPQLFRGVGIIFCILSISVMAFATLPQHQIKDSTSFFTLFRNIGGAIGIALINSVAAIRFNDHQAQIAETANPGRPEIAERLEMLAAAAAARGFPDPDNFALRALAREIRRQALTMAYADAFLLLAVLFGFFALVPIFLRKPGTFADPLPEAH
ncbi:MAG: DHA2 family efflux MFS transporter permease subunit [Sphingomonadaceae bacterium]